MHSISFKGVIGSKLVALLGVLFGTGANTYFQLGRSYPSNSYNLITIDKEYIFINCDVGLFHSLFINNNGHLYGSGLNTDSRLGLPTTSNNKYILTLIDNAKYYYKVSAGHKHSLFLTNSGDIYGVGLSNVGQLIDKPSQTVSTISLLSNQIDKFVDISSGLYHSIFLRNDGKVFGCGTSENGQLHINDTNINLSLTSIDSTNNYLAINGKNYLTTLIKDDGSVWYCGLFNGINNYTLQLIDNTNKYVAVYNGFDHILLLREDGTLWGLGYSTHGELGIVNSIYNILRPIDNTNKYITICAGYDGSLFIRDDGSLWGCGSQFNGILGLGNNSLNYTLTLIDNKNKYINVSLHNQHTLCIKENPDIVFNINGDNNSDLSLYIRPITIGSLTKDLVIKSNRTQSISFLENSTLSFSTSNLYLTTFCLEMNCYVDDNTTGNIINTINNILTIDFDYLILYFSEELNNSLYFQISIKKINNIKTIVNLEKNTWLNIKLDYNKSNNTFRFYKNGTLLAFWIDNDIVLNTSQIKFINSNFGTSFNYSLCYIEDIKLTNGTNKGSGVSQF